jgi:transcriptional regulator with XRE-family HTH domain
LRRAYTAQTVAQRAGIARATLSRVERGDAAVSLGIYARVLQALGLESDLAHIASHDELGRKLQDAGLGERVRAPRRKA